MAEILSSRLKVGMGIHVELATRSKMFSREIAEYFADWGLDVRIVCPAVVLGPGDLRPTPSGQLVISMFTPGLPALHYDGGACYVDVRDAARVHLLAAKRGKPGERYLAAGENLTNEEFVQTIKRVASTNKPLVKLPVTVARTVAKASRGGAASIVAAQNPGVAKKSVAPSDWIRSTIVVADVFSMPPKMKSSTTTWAYFSYGYGTPKRCSNSDTISAVRPNARAASRSDPGAT